jgi:ABC-type uncharacterized transport system permease subunit
MADWSVYWLRAALLLYSVGLWHALRTVVEQRQQRFLAALTSISVGMAFHLVSLVFDGIAVGGIPTRTPYQMASLIAFLITVVFLTVYIRYRYESLAVFVFPLVFVLSFVASLGTPLEPWITNSVGGGWVAVHVGLFLLGYAALFVTCVAGVMYLIQERELKSKHPRAFYYRLPPLTKLDQVSYQTLAFGFVSVTLGVIVASISAAAQWGSNWIVDPQIALAFITWGIYLAMIFSRVTIGWRGRKSAYFSIAGFAFAALSAIVNSGVHSFIQR